jgi:hypothetical protein
VNQALLKREDEAWRSFAEEFAAVPAGLRDVEGVVPGWSVHDVIWHCAYWIDYAGQVLERILGGDPDPEDSEESEAEILAAGRALSWDEIIDRADQGRRRVRAALDSFEQPPEQALEWFEDDTFDHYDEHAAQIHAFAQSR